MPRKHVFVGRMLVSRRPSYLVPLIACALIGGGAAGIIAWPLGTSLAVVFAIIGGNVGCLLIAAAVYPYKARRSKTSDALTHHPVDEWQRDG